jgi:hypothetical protein
MYCFKDGIEELCCQVTMLISAHVKHLRGYMRNPHFKEISAGVFII